MACSLPVYCRFDIERGLKAAFLRYLTKLINVDEFMASIHLALNGTTSVSAI
jgi:hypothetical protein